MSKLSERAGVVGVDEAGRGPLAGPVFAGAVMLDPKKHIQGLADSKELTPEVRFELFQEIREKALAWSFARVGVAEIDTINIYHAAMLAMQKAVARLKVVATLVIVDGNRSPEFTCESQAIVRGDALEPAISAASIVAKVMRDRFMLMLDKKYPHYGFAKHKGYATLEHLSALYRLGPSKVHRCSFEPVSISYAAQKLL